MDKKICKIDMNKVILLVSSFLVLIVLTFIIDTYKDFSEKSSKNTFNNKNEYAASNKVVNIKEKNNNNNSEVSSNIKEENVSKDNEITKESELLMNVEPIQEVVETQEETNNNEIKNINEKTITFFETTESEIETSINEEQGISEKAKEKFVMLVDFIFYGTEINGVTFEQLTEETKQKLIDIVNRIDLKIEEKVPGYKETISSGAKMSYTYLVDKLKQGITYVDGKIEEKIGTEKYDQIKEEVDESVEKIKEGGSKVLDKGKELFGTAKDKIKNWYEGWK